MSAEQFRSNEDGSAAIEFSILGPVYLLMILGAIQVAVWLWSNFALQHGVEMAARCASVNTTTCNSTSAIQNYAKQNSYGLPVPASAFTVTTATCGKSVTASFSYLNFLTIIGVPSFTATGAACYPV